MAIDLTLLACTTLTLLTLHHLIGRLLRRRRSTLPLPLPPGPLGLPILGALPFIGPMPHAGLARLARRYGGIMYLKMGTCGIAVASTPAAARAFLKPLDAQFADRPPLASAKHITYANQNLVFANYTPKWKLLRKLSSLHLLGGRALASWAPARRNEVGRMVRSMCELARTGTPVDLPEELSFAMANIIGQVTVSRRLFDSPGKEHRRFKAMVAEATGGGMFNIGDFVPAIAWMDLQGIQAKLRRVHQWFDDMIAKMVKEHEATAGERVGRPDFLDLIRANMEGEEGEGLSDANIRGLIFDLFTAGADTSSIIIEWAVAEMLRNPTVLKRAQSEIDGLVGRERRLEESDLPNLPYLQAVVKEVLRKHPSTPLSLPHFSSQECEVEGYYIPKNTRLLVNIWAIGRDPTVWENPLEFDPERFLSGKGAKIEPHGNDFELIPFGAGRRICAGKQAGMLFVQYVLGTLVHCFDWRLPEGVAEVDMHEVAGITIPKAVPLTAAVNPRLAPAAYL